MLSPRKNNWLFEIFSSLSPPLFSSSFFLKRRKKERKENGNIYSTLIKRKEKEEKEKSLRKYRRLLNLKSLLITMQNELSDSFDSVKNVKHYSHKKTPFKKLLYNINIAISHASKKTTTRLSPHAPHLMLAILNFFCLNGHNSIIPPLFIESRNK